MPSVAPSPAPTIATQPNTPPAPAPTSTPPRQTPPASTAPSQPPTESPESIFALIPGDFIYASGVGAWATELTIAADGTFTGNYHDSNMGDTGPDYPNGTRYVSVFSGRFTLVQKVSDVEYQLTLTSLNVQGTVGAESIEDGVKVITSDPAGFDAASDFTLYLPGRRPSDLPEEFLFWVQTLQAWDTVPDTLPMWGLYNVVGQAGFVGPPA